MDGSALEEKSFLKMLWMAISIIKTAYMKIGALIHSMKFPSPEAAQYLDKSTIWPCKENFCHV